MGNYIFISYAHKDKDKVEPIIKYLQDSGLEVWYDKGIEVGTEWSKIIASQLVNCRMMIAFISPNYVESPNCNRETTFAVSENKPAIVAYLEPTTLTPELKLNLCIWQAIYRNRFNSDEEFAQEIYRSKVVRGDDLIEETPYCYKQGRYLYEWWLRSSGLGADRAASVNSVGSVYCGGCYVANTSFAVLPALRINL